MTDHFNPAGSQRQDRGRCIGTNNAETSIRKLPGNFGPNRARKIQYRIDIGLVLETADKDNVAPLMDDVSPVTVTDPVTV